MRDALGNFSTRVTSQREPVPGRSDTVPNDAGGYGFAVSDWTRALRFLILGTDGGTYYVTERDLTKQNAEVIVKLANTEGEKLVSLILDVSERGRAPRQNPTLFALAACTASPDIETRRAALAAIPRVCRTGTMLFIFARYVEQFRGWGRGLRAAISDWYMNKPVDQVAYQAVKYRQREGWSHRDLLRLSHPYGIVVEPDRRALFSWICKHEIREDAPLPKIVTGFKLAQVDHKDEPGRWAELVTQYELPWEALPDAAMNEAVVWEALLPHTGLTALVRQLGRLTNLGLIAPMGGQTRKISERLMDADEIKRSRIHPLQLLVAHVTYASGHGFRGASAWTPNPKIIDALNDAFYLSFGNVEPANKRTLIACDVSGSMTWGTVANSPLTPLVATGALAMLALRTEPDAFPMAFSHEFKALPISVGMRLTEVVQTMRALGFGGTNCALPMEWALKNKVSVDTFQVLTDSETWAGGSYPFQELQKYRDAMGIPARLAVVGMVSNGFTIADPTDAGMLDVVGFDTSAPAIINAFSRGEV